MQFTEEKENLLVVYFKGPSINLWLPILFLLVLQYCNHRILHFKQLMSLMLNGYHDNCRISFWNDYLYVIMLHF